MINQNTKNEVAIVGPIPPPYGGIANHIERLTKHLDLNRVSYRIINHKQKAEHKLKKVSSLFFYINFLFCCPYKVVHFHQTLNGFEFIYWYLFSRLHRSKIIITIHNQYLLNASIVVKNIQLYFLRKTKYLKLYIVSNNLYEFLSANSIGCRHLPSYVPLLAEKRTGKMHKNEQNAVMFNAFRLNSNNANSVYGFDLFMGIVKKYDFPYLILVADEIGSDRMYIESQVLNLCRNVRILYNQNLIDYLENTMILIRPNRSDAFGISIQEALDVEVMVIASDVCSRPQGAILFKTGSFEDLDKKFDDLLKMTFEEKVKLFSNVEKTFYHTEIINLYSQLLEENETNYSIPKNR